MRPSEMSELTAIDVEKRLREKRDKFVLKQQLSAKSDVWKHFSLVFEQLFDFEIKARGSGRVGSGRKKTKSLRVGSGHVQVFAGRVGSQNLDPRATLRGRTGFKLLGT